LTSGRTNDQSTPCKRTSIGCQRRLRCRQSSLCRRTREVSPPLYVADRCSSLESVQSRRMNESRCRRSNFRLDPYQRQRQQQQQQQPQPQQWQQQQTGERSSSPTRDDRLQMAGFGSATRSVRSCSNANDASSTSECLAESVSEIFRIDGVRGSRFGVCRSDEISTITPPKSATSVVEFVKQWQIATATMADSRVNPIDDDDDDDFADDFDDGYHDDVRPPMASSHGGPAMQQKSARCHVPEAHDLDRERGQEYMRAVGQSNMNCPDPTGTCFCIRIAGRRVNRNGAGKIRLSGAAIFLTVKVQINKCDFANRCLL